MAKNEDRKEKSMNKENVEKKSVRKDLKQKLANNKIVLNLKEWLRMVIEKSSNRRNKIPKISATFKLVVVEVEKGKEKLAIEVLKKNGVKMSMILLGYKGNSDSLKLFSIQQNEIEVILSLVSAENMPENLCQTICNLLKAENINFARAFAIKPSSADLNLIYLLRKGEL